MKNQKSLSNSDSPSGKNERERAGAALESRAAEWMRRRGYRLVEANKAYAGVQVDLVMKSREGHFVIVEVKSSGVFERGILSPSQKRRLQRAQTLFSGFHGPTELLVLVEEGVDGFVEIPIQD